MSESRHWPLMRPLIETISKEEARRSIEETAARDTSLNVDWDCEHSLVESSGPDAS